MRSLGIERVDMLTTRARGWLRSVHCTIDTDPGARRLFALATAGTQSRLMRPLICATFGAPLAAETSRCGYCGGLFVGMAVLGEVVEEVFDTFD